MMESNVDPSVLYEEILEKIDRVNTKISSMKELHDVNLTDECSELARISCDMARDYEHYHGKLSSSHPEVKEIQVASLNDELERVISIEYRACDIVLTKLIEKFSAYAKELEESLINTGELRKAINEAKRHQATAHASQDVSDSLADNVKLLDNEIEQLSAANSTMTAKEPEEKRRIAFRLAEIYVGLFAAVVVAYVTYAVGYPNSKPFSSGNLFLVGIGYVIACLLIYVAIGAMAKVRH
jgi:hypothetical protein